MAEIKEHEKTEAEVRIEPSAESVPQAEARPEQTPAPPVGGPSEAAVKKRQKARRRKIRRLIITLVIVFVVVGAIIYGMYRLFREEEVITEALTVPVMRGSIQSMVTGWGSAMPRDSETITLSAGGTVMEVFVRDGDIVHEGDPLYVIHSATAEQAVTTARDKVENIEKQIREITDSYADLTVRAEYGGILIKTAKIRPGDTVVSGTNLATLVDDSRMKFELFFSYTYAEEIHTGQTASVSVPAMMSEISGVVAEVNYVRRVTPEGSRLFSVTVEVENSGTLAEEMDVSATLKNGDGEEIYPYEAGKLEYSRTTDIVTKAGGKALSVNLIDYLPVTAGQMLLHMDGDDNADRLDSLQRDLRTAQEDLEKARDNLNNFNAFSKISGTVLSCSLVTGETVDTGRAAVSIANTSEMVIEAQIDDLNIAYVKAGMFVDVTQYSRDEMLSFAGVVESVSLEAKFENGRSYFPAKIKVDNFDGKLMAGMGVDYSLVASQSDDCLIVPIQAIVYTPESVCVFLKTDVRPENALDAEAAGVPVPEGFYAVPVVIGISDNYSVEIISGVNEMDEVFTQYGIVDDGMGGMGRQGGVSRAVMIG